jgi:UDP-N-acetylmuramate--alanine ligase
MSGLALAAVSLGAEVTGSERAAPSSLARLESAGVRVVVGHAAENVPDGAEVVYSSAVKDDNVERGQARSLGLRQVRRGDLLAELTTLQRCVAIAGSHGKTTTSAMTAYVLRAAGVSTSYVVGAELRDGSPSAVWEPAGEWVVVETDESDRSFLALEPEIGVVTNVEREHLDAYGSVAELRRAFACFIAQSQEVVVPHRPDILDLCGAGGVTTFEAREVQLDRVGAGFVWRGHQVRLSVPGEHNARNAAAALEACCLAGVDAVAAVRAIARFPGAKRRIELLGRTAAGTRVYEDYAGHPNTIRATLAAIGTIEAGRVVVVFEPLLYTRTQAMAGDLGAALAVSDELLVLDIYPGSEAGQSHPGVSGALVADAARERGARRVVSTPTIDEARVYLESTLVAGDVCLLLGVGPTPQLLARALVTQE